VSAGTESRPLRSQIHGTRINQVIHFDFLFVGLTDSSNYILIIKEDITGYVWLIHCDEPTAQVVANALEDWFSIFGVAEVWISDQGSHFRNQVLDRIREKLRVKHRFTHPYCAWSNGTIERVCRDVLRLLRALYSEQPGTSVNDWPKLIKLCQLTLNGTFRASLGTTPMRAFIGSSDSTFDAIFSGQNSLETVSLDEVQRRHKDLVRSSIEALDLMHIRLAEKRSVERAGRIKAHNERTNVLEPQFVVGDFVLVAADVTGMKFLQNLAVRWKGPCRIIRMVSETTYEVEDLVHGKREVLHYAHLRRYCDHTLNVTELLKEAIACNEAMLKEFRVEKVLRLKRTKDGIWQVFVQWAGYKDPTWEPAESMRADLPRLLNAFLLTEVPLKTRVSFERTFGVHA
jgi:hypothetical protein